jgi:hypothetical protein
MWDDKKNLGISKRWHLASPLPTFIRNQNMGNKMVKGNWQNKWMGGMRWANAKIDWENLFKHNVNISKDDMEDYNWMMFTHAMDVFKKCASLKTDSKIFFHKFT